MVKKTIQRLDWATPEQQKKALDLINGKTSPDVYESVKIWLEQCFTMPLYDDRVIVALNEVLKCHGVESVACLHSYKYPMVSYLNTGDIYTTTVVYRLDLAKRWDIVDVGTLVEILERKGYAL